MQINLTVIDYFGGKSYKIAWHLDYSITIHHCINWDMKIQDRFAQYAVLTGKYCEY